MISKDEYLLRNFSKITHKKWELFVITRILHLVNDPDIEYICQQYVNPPNSNKYYLTDLCFPSLKLYCEIDEGQHASKDHINDDKIRQREILDATDWKEYRIRVYDKNDHSKGRALNEVISEIDEFVNYIKNRKKEFESKSGKKITWDYEAKFSPQPHIDKGYIDVKDNVVFLYHKDALRLFGYKGKHFQRAYWRVKGFNQAVWFPKLYDNIPWKNALTDGSSKITQEKYINGELCEYPLPSNEERIVFAHYKNVLGQTVYKFYGKFQVDWENTNSFTNIFKRSATRIDLKDYN
ncbi:uncharacterized protein METZ01_LOCUS212823 [marine metagenome]|uniref:Uncharacterized protein n=1 Tax=marine metagenome TaxID=408172 RepID=A0A382FBB5_9ZZZZ|tara:strand:- start:143 stop:1024 length:882 start_codon:yes stop_codon:yes gene_type:complete